MSRAVTTSPIRESLRYIFDTPSGTTMPCVYTESDPATSFAPITPSDSTDMATCRGIYVGVGGNIVAVAENNNVATFSDVPAGSILPVRAKRINATGTTASSLVALY